MSNIQLHSEFFNGTETIQKFAKIIGEKRARQFATSILTVVADNQSLQNASPHSVYQAALIAATLDLSILPSIGEAWIVPYAGKAQFQLGYLGLIQLADRTGRYKRINAIPVYENQFHSFNYLTEELKGDFSIEGKGNVVGYCAYFILHDGREKTIFWTLEEVKQHARKYGTYEKKYQNGSFVKSPWNDPVQFPKMALKTVLKELIKKWGPKSVELEKALQADQAVVIDAENNKFEYVDNPENQTVDISAEILGNDEILE